MIYITGNTHGDINRFETEQTKNLLPKTISSFAVTLASSGTVEKRKKTAGTIKSKTIYHLIRGWYP